MINSVYGGVGVVVSGGTSTNPYINMNNPSAGMVRYNGSADVMEVYDGYSWISFGNSSAQVTLDPSVTNVIEWARKKMEEENKIKLLADKYPAIKDLQEKLELMIALVQDYKQE